VAENSKRKDGAWGIPSPALLILAFQAFAEAIAAEFWHGF
jgi:hypothetical protein